MSAIARFPVLLGDIGGTFARFAIIAEPEQPFQLLAKDTTSAHRDPTSAILSAMASYSGAKPVCALLAVAGPVTGPVAHLTNAGWTIDSRKIGRELGLKEVMLLNDYSAAAAGLTTLAETSGSGVTQIGAQLKGLGPQVILGPGTGLGAAALIPFASRLVIQSTEAGHIEFGAITDNELHLWPMIERERGRMTAETLLSGPGLVRLYRALALARKVDHRIDTPSEIVESGLSGKDPLTTETLHLFCRLLGRFAGDLALVFGATGGVFMAGGVALRMATILAKSDFRAAFERKSPFKSVMRETPTFLITHPEPVLVGLSTLAAHPRRFLFHAGRWRSRST